MRKKQKNMYDLTPNAMTTREVEQASAQDKELVVHKPEIMGQNDPQKEHSML